VPQPIQWEVDRTPRSEARSADMARLVALICRRSVRAFVARRSGADRQFWRWRVARMNHDSPGTREHEQRRSAWMLVGVFVGVCLEQMLCLGNCEERVRGLRWVPQEQ
jgi:hypothetical protein